jgi:hypothetical protein
MRNARLLAMASCLACPVAADVTPPVAVHFTSRTAAQDGAAMKKAALAARDELGRKYEALYKSYAERFGADQAKWPPDKQKEIRTLFDTASDQGPEFEAEYASATPQELAESAKQLSELTAELRGDLVRVVDRPDLAELVVEVTGRRGWRSDIEVTENDRHGLVVKLSAGGKLAPGRLRDGGRGYRWPDDPSGQDVIRETHRFSPREPFWQIQVESRSHNYTGVVSGSMVVIADFIEATLIPPAPGSTR